MPIPIIGDTEHIANQGEEVPGMRTADVGA